MSIIRVAKRSRFTTIDRVTLNDGRLSFRARGVLSWLLDKPDDWSVRSEAIAEASDKDGRDAIRTALKELRAFGYLVTRKIKDPETGRFSTETIVYEQSQGADETAGQPGDGISGAGQPDDGIPEAGNSGASMNTENDYEERKTFRAEASPPADEPRTLKPFEEDFNKTWKHYPHKEARKAALKAYQSCRRGGVDPAALHRATQVYAFVLKATGRTPMNGATFYGPNERWKDWLDRDVALARERGRGGSGRPGGQDPPVGRPNPTEAERCSKCGSLIVGGLCGCP